MPAVHDSRQAGVALPGAGSLSCSSTTKRCRQAASVLAGVTVCAVRAGDSGATTRQPSVRRPTLCVSRVGKTSPKRSESSRRKTAMAPSGQSRGQLRGQACAVAGSAKCMTRCRRVRAGRARAGCARLCCGAGERQRGWCRLLGGEEVPTDSTDQLPTEAPERR